MTKICWELLQSNLLDGEQIGNAASTAFEEVYPASVETVGTLYVGAGQ
jgi:hypothetical protein